IDLESGPDLLLDYLGLVRRTGINRYPGSPLLASFLLRRTDRLIAIERQPDEAAALMEVLAPFANAKAIAADGYARLSAMLPPRERRGVVVLDPPYEDKNEFVAVAGAFEAAHRRFSTGVYLIWYPLKSESDANAFTGEIIATGAHKV